MRILRDEITSDPCVLALGTFDGVHRGHRALLKRGLMMAEEQSAGLCVCTFDVHPREVFDPENAPKRLTTLPERASLLAEADVDLMRILPFNRRVAAMPPEDFLAMLAERFCPSGIVCGDDYTFGRYGSGNKELLMAWAEKNGMPAAVVSEVRVNGRRVSSTLIREELTAGNAAGAAELLGHGYTLSGIVESGKKMGRELGFPTANIAVSARKLLPAYGVYTCLAEWTGMKAPAVVNIGSQPTLPSGRVTVEAHILTGSYDLYGRHVRLTLREFLRPERPFAGIDELKKQIEADKAEALHRFEIRR